MASIPNNLLKLRKKAMAGRREATVKKEMGAGRDHDQTHTGRSHTSTTSTVKAIKSTIVAIRILVAAVESALITRRKMKAPLQVHLNPKRIQPKSKKRFLKSS